MAILKIALQPYSTHAKNLPALKQRFWPKPLALKYLLSCDSKYAVRESIMGTYTIRDVRLLQQADTKITRIQLVHTTHNNRSCYEITFVFSNKNIHQQFLLITTRNHPYRLMDLNRGIKFIRKIFPNVSTITLSIKPAR